MLSSWLVFLLVPDSSYYQTASANSVQCVIGGSVALLLAAWAHLVLSRPPPVEAAAARRRVLLPAASPALTAATAAVTAGAGAVPLYAAAELYAKPPTPPPRKLEMVEESELGTHIEWKVLCFNLATYAKCDTYVPQWWVEFSHELSWLFIKSFLSCLQKIAKSLPKVPILLSFIYLVALNLLTTNQPTQLIIGTHNCHKGYLLLI